MKNKLALLSCVAALAAQPSAAAPAQPEGLERIRHIVVIVLENHSFDSLYGRFPGANGLAQAGPDTSMQGDLDGRLYETLPEVKGDGGKPDLRFPGDLPNEPFDIGAFASASQKIPNLTHRFYLHQEQIDGGRMDHYAALSEVGGLVMGHYDAGLSPMGAFARQYTVADNFFQAAFGGSFLNHQWLVCACTPRYEGAPAELKTQLDANGKAVKERALTPDGYAVNTLQPFAAPFDAKAADPALRLPPQLQPTIGDRLSAKNVSWAWYSGGWNDAVAGHPDPSFQFHHQPFAYYKNYGPGSKGRAEHLKDATDFLRGVERGSLPAVAFYKPIGSLNEHPGYADLLSGERHVADVIEKIQDSPLWGNTAIIVTYDEYGGFWDHVPPPEGDRWGPGTRVPTLIISPYARHGHVDHTLYDATSILKFIETRFGLQPLGPRDEKAGDLLNAFDFRP